MCCFAIEIEVETNVVTSLPTSLIKEKCFWFRKKILNPNVKNKFFSSFCSSNQSLEDLTKTMTDKVS